MKAVIQRVQEASVTVDGRLISEIGEGLLILLGVTEGDGDKEIEWFVRKIAQMRIFEDEAGLMNKSVEDKGGSVIVVSQFTLYADCQKGNRPSFVKAAPAEVAREVYDRFIAKMRERLGEDRVGTGVFQAEMKVRLLNDGPVTIVLE